MHFLKVGYPYIKFFQMG
uniref:Uncharacterized protein n=1 Tax=Anguilla anguilla TaxID=7936 RepID=A0A0E9RMZ6_ANGAN